MEKSKNRFEIILGIITLIISLSAFKEELAKINIDLGFKTITLAEYFLYCIYGFSLSLYFYILEIVARDTEIGKWKIFDLIQKIAFICFILVLISPILLIIITSSNELDYFLNKYERFNNVLKIINSTLSIIIGILTLLYTVKVSRKYQKEVKEKFQKNIEEEEIKSLGKSRKLFLDGYYSHSILESFKVLETYLFKKIIKKNIRVSRHRFSDLIKIALSEKIINENELNEINNIRRMRNASAHTETEYTKIEAEKSLEFVKNIIQN